MTAELTSLADLRAFVQSTICEHQHLLLQACGVREKILVRSGQPCGMHFTMCGPRSVRFSAIWDAARQVVLFYDCKGERFHRSDLGAAPVLLRELAGLLAQS